MYLLPPPAEALDWSLGLVMDVCLKIGLGKPNVMDESWTEAEISEILSISQIRHWYERPPGKQSASVQRFVAAVTDGEPFAKEWKKVINASAAKEGRRSEERHEKFGITRFGKRARDDVIVPKLMSLEPLRLLENQDPMAKNTAVVRGTTSLMSGPRGRAVIGVSAAVLLVVFVYLLQLSWRQERFGHTFTNIQFCLDETFQYIPKNQCLSDTRVFSSKHDKINLSFEAAVEIEPGSTLNLQWFRNGVLQMERPRPWLKAFAFDLKYASTHIKMTKNGALPPEWSDPGRYHVRFFLNDVLVDETRFDIVELDEENVASHQR